MAVRVRVFLILIASVTAHAFIDEAVNVLRLGKEIGEEVLESWDLIGKPFNVSAGVDLPIIRRRERLILSRLAHISRAIQRLELGIEKNGAVAMLLAKASSRGAKLELRLHEMADLLSRVTSADRQMREYVRLQRELEQSTLQDFAEWCVSHDRGALAGLLERVHSLIAPPYKNLLGGGLLQLILDDLKANRCVHLCWKNQLRIPADQDGDGQGVTPFLKYLLKTIGYSYRLCGTPRDRFHTHRDAPGEPQTAYSINNR